MEYRVALTVWTKLILNSFYRSMGEIGSTLTLACYLSSSFDSCVAGLSTDSLFILIILCDLGNLVTRLLLILLFIIHLLSKMEAVLSLTHTAMHLMYRNRLRMNVLIYIKTCLP